ncbi:alpha/beta hydrolase-fold protein [Candidatus Neomarinimicrobiota bacterium]
MNLKSRTITRIIPALLIISSFCFGQTAINNILLGQTISIESKILNETREVFVFTPDGYEQGNESFPVIYVLDGETHFFIASAIANFLANNQRIPKTIVVGIPNIARNRDFTPAVKQQPNSGGADNFIKFLDEELMNFVDNKYRTQDFNVLFGHSLCGMFSVYTLFTNSELFDAYIAASPWLMYDNEYVVKKAEEKLVSKSNFISQIYMSIGNEPAYFNSLDKLTSLLTVNESGINWTLEKYEDEDHGSIPFRTISDGLGYIFSDWQLTNDIAMKGVDAIKNHFLNRSKKYGFTSQITENALNTIGYQLLQSDQNEKAIEVFKYAVDLYPKSANAYDSLGDGFDKIGKKKKALKNYKNAVAIGSITNDVNLQAFKNNVERLSK